MALKDAADEYVEPSSKPKTPEPVKKPEEDFEEDETGDAVEEQAEDTEAEVVVEGTDVYKEYIGKRVLHKSVGYGVVRTCDGKYLGIEFESGPKAGKVTNYSLEACLSKGLISDCVGIGGARFGTTFVNQSTVARSWMGRNHLPRSMRKYGLPKAEWYSGRKKRRC